MGQHVMGEGPLHDDAGRLIDPGYAAHEVRRYDRAAIAAEPVRIKEWDYYCVMNADLALALTVADNAYAGFLGVSWMDLRAGNFVNHGVLIPEPMGRMALPASADRGDIVQATDGMELAFRHEAGGRRLTVHAPGFADGRGLSGEIWLDQPAMDRMVIATPFADDPHAFYYNQKINCMPARGSVKIGNESHDFLSENAFALLDWGRGVWTYDNVWYWGSASGLVDGRRFGFNIGYGFGDTSAASENMLFVDGRAHKLDEVTFHMPEGPPDSGNWRFSSNDGRFEIDFAPAVNRWAKVDAGMVRTEQDQVFGWFSGRVILDDGTAMTVRDLPGFAEKVWNRW
ncbi:hypothetical protein ASD67_20025 [Sphingopyxis sp. Root1497]|uniref:DUF2804 domain-containing protein n=1 Tax=Sphingopyxis sp. Root1497 TaxID=1736474 RepID=UPI0006FD9E38|nr:DUF2804 domain-containing protein [Sphingopyxis sp. Root1497]KQZ61501.1 hypothetical protein ASD67_20025 [Sphingopyxis sp. Root1497]